MSKYGQYNASFELAKVHQEMLREARAQERSARQAEQTERAAATTWTTLPRRIGNVVWTLIRQSVRTSTVFFTNP